MVEADAYALELSRYIHLNPVRAKMVVKLEDYPWSSYRSYIGHNVMPAWLETDVIHGYLEADTLFAPKAYRRFVEDRLVIDYDSPLNATVASTILGTEDFVSAVSDRHLGPHCSARNLPAVKALARRSSIDTIIMTVNAELGDRASLSRRGNLYGCQKYSGAKLKDIGVRFGISDAAVSQASRRVTFQAETDVHLKQILERVEACIENVNS